MSAEDYLLEFDHDIFSEEQQEMSAEDYWDDRLPYDDDYEDEDSLVTLNYDRIARETDKAYLIIFEEGDDFAEPPEKEVSAWIPKSQIEELYQDEKRVSIPEWLAERNDLI